MFMFGLLWQEVWCTSKRCLWLQHSTATDQAKGAAHKAASDKHFQSQGFNPRDHTDKK